uniref:Uncharacterized protein n=1 Tax=Anguilla anguilla TaxID=7936 RepID=A0A0E9PF97_ANGAN
MGAGGGSI